MIEIHYGTTIQAVCPFCGGETPSGVGVGPVAHCAHFKAFMVKEVLGWPNSYDGQAVPIFVDGAESEYLALFRQSS